MPGEVLGAPVGGHLEVEVCRYHGRSLKIEDFLLYPLDFSSCYSSLCNGRRTAEETLGGIVGG